MTAIAFHSYMILGSPSYLRGTQHPKASLIDEHLGFFLSCIFPWDALSMGTIGKMKQPIN